MKRTRWVVFRDGFVLPFLAVGSVFVLHDKLTAPMNEKIAAFAFVMLMAIYALVGSSPDGDK